jgi:hypothetical protein
MKSLNKSLQDFNLPEDHTPENGIKVFLALQVLLPALSKVVKVLLTFSLLLAVSDVVCAPVDCTMELQLLENQLEPLAGKLTGHPMKVQVVMTDQMPTEYEGIADSRGSRIFINPNVCSHSHLSKLSLLAHETGHLVSHSLWKNIREDSYSGANNIGTAVHEGLADEYASKMLSDLGMLDEAINMLIPVCEASSRLQKEQVSNDYSRTACSHLAIFKLEQKPLVKISEDDIIAPPHG